MITKQNKSSKWGSILILIMIFSVLTYNPTLSSNDLKFERENSSLEEKIISEKSFHPKGALGIVGNYSTIGYTIDLVMRDNIAYIGDSAQCFHIVNMTDPQNPTLIAIKPIAGNVTDMAIEGNVLFVSDDDGNLYSWDVSDPTNVWNHGSISEPFGAINGISVDENIVYLSIFMDMLPINATDPEFMDDTLASTGLSNEGKGITKNGDMVFVTQGTSGIDIINASKPNDLDNLATYSTNLNAVDITVSNDIAYISNGESGLFLINVSDPTTPTYINDFDTDGFTESFLIDGNFGYIADGNKSIKKLDISNPLDLKVIAEFNVSGHIRRLAIDENNLYAANYGMNQTHVIPLEEILLTELNPSKLDKVVELDWNELQSIEAYDIYRSDQPIDDYKTLSPLATIQTSAYVNIVSNEGVYYYMVVARNASRGYQISGQVIVNVQEPLSSLAYRSVAGFLNLTLEYWKFDEFQVEYSEDTYNITADSIQKMEYGVEGSSWNAHPRLKSPFNIAYYINITSYNDSIISRSSYDYLYLPNLYFKENRTSAELIDLLEDYFPSEFSNSEISGSGVKFWKTNEKNQTFIYLNVNQTTGYLDEFYHLNNSIDILHIIKEDNPDLFVEDLFDISYPEFEDDQFFEMSSDENLNLASIDDEDGLYIPLDSQAESNSTLYRYRTTGTQPFLISYEEEDDGTVIDNTWGVSQPGVQFMGTALVGEVEYYDPSTDSWAPSSADSSFSPFWKPLKHAEGDNLYILSTANKETIAPPISDGKPRLPMVLAEDVPLPRSDDIKAYIGENASVVITDRSIYIEQIVDGQVMFLDADYGENGAISTFSAKLPGATGFTSFGGGSMTAAEANIYMENARAEYLSSSTDTDSNPIEGNWTDSLLAILQDLLENGTLYYIVGVIILVGIGIFVFKRRSKSDSGNDTFQDNEESPTIGSSQGFL